jgi:hypothetical protein
MLVSDLVGTNIASLGESLLADITGEGLFARMASLMCLVMTIICQDAIPSSSVGGPLGALP